MSILKSVALQGVWGEKNFDLQFHPDVNFLIGSNGSGKTTIINLVAAVLTAEYDALERTPFSSIACNLISKEKGEIAVVVRRSKTESEGSPIDYAITVEGKTRNFQLLPSHMVRYTINRERRVTVADQVETELRSLVRLRWLSVHRTPAKSRVEERSSLESTVDRRLQNLGNRLVRYFSKQAAKRETETELFLRQLFLALLYTGGEGDVIEESRKMDLGVLESSLVGIFERFDLAVPEVLDQLHRHFEMAKEAAASKAGYLASQLAALIGLQAMHKVVDAWNLSLKRQAEIDRPQREFLDLINAMVKGKRFGISLRNELEAVLLNGKHLSLLELSSGEKQLVIILGEALLQEGEEFIYIADEPELSLHVSWQERLTANLRKVNPSAQVIFATHSPDIVSEYGDHVIDMEKLQA